MVAPLFVMTQLMDGAKLVSWAAVALTVPPAPIDVPLKRENTLLSVSSAWNVTPAYAPDWSLVRATVTWLDWRTSRGVAEIATAIRGTIAAMSNFILRCLGGGLQNTMMFFTGKIDWKL